MTVGDISLEIGRWVQELKSVDLVQKRISIYSGYTEKCQDRMKSK